MPAGSKGRIAMFERQEPAVLNQAAPVQNTYYPILDTSEFVRVYGIAVNIEDNDETLNVRITIDGEVLIGGSVGCTNSTTYHVYRQLDAIARELDIGMNVTNFLGQLAFMLEGHSVLIEVRKTTAAGVGNLTGVVEWGVLTDVP